MGMREENPFIEQDLAVVISTFERRMARSRDQDSVFVGFRRDLEGYANVPASFIDSIDLLPSIKKELSSDEEDSSGKTREGQVVRTGTFRVPSPEETVGEITSDETTEDEELTGWEAEIASWEECQPCDFRQMWEDAQGFGEELTDLWDGLLDDILDRLPNLEDLLDQSDINLADLLCSLFDAFKFQCNPDLEKIAFLLGQLLDQMEIELTDNLSGIFDSLLTALLEPLFNAMMSSLDLIEEILLGPVQCIIDEIQRQIEQISRNKNAFESAMNYNPSENSVQAEAERQRSEIQENDRAEQQSQRSPQAALDGMNETVSTLEQAATLEVFKRYLERAHTFMREKKDWLVSQLADLIGQQTEEFNRRLDFARGKTSILQFISLIKAIIELARSGELECGPGASAITEEEYKLLIGKIRHPAEASDIFVEDGMIVVRRRETISTRGERPVISLGEEGTPLTFENIVVRRPIASCLKKVTPDQAEQAKQWISQLEQEI